MTTNTLVEECWATHECLRRLGVQAKDIFIHVAEYIVVEARYGEKSFTVILGRCLLAPAFVEEWKVFANRANAEAHLPEKLDYYTTILNRSAPRRDAVSFMVAFLGKGFEVKNRNGTRKVLETEQ